MIISRKILIYIKSYYYYITIIEVDLYDKSIKKFRKIYFLCKKKNAT